MMPQPTGYPGPAGGGSSMLGSFNAVPSTFVSTFMPANMAMQQQHQQPLQPMQTGYPIQQQPQMQQQQLQPLPQYFAQHNQQVSGRTAVQVQWALTADERRKYDQIFRAWDNGTGYITGQRALEVFRESGLERDDLMKIWALADRENRGKLNLAEFHVSMGLIYRRLSGNPIPDVLPQELIPPSSQDLNQSVDFLKDLLRNDTNARSTNLDPNSQQQGSSTGASGGNKYAKVRSFAADASPNPKSGNRKDATGYKHDDGQARSYKSTSRHLDRRNVRFQGEDDDDELAGMRRDLQSTQQMLDSSLKDDDEDEDLKAEIEDLKYRIRRVKDDIEYNKTGRRTEAKDEERRRLERELLFLMHDKLPELEDKMRDRDRTKRSSDRAAARKRDARNNSTRYDSQRNGRQEVSDSDSDEPENRAPDKGYLRASHRRESPQFDRPSASNLPPGRDTPERSKPRNIDSAAPAPPVPVAAQLEANVPPPPPAPPATAAAPVARKPQTAEERQAFIRAEAQRRVQERMRVLTGQSPSASPPPEIRPSAAVDSTVQDRIEQDKKEAAERAADEDRALQERERQRQLRLEEEKLGNLRKEEKQLADTSKALDKVGQEVTAAAVHAAAGDRTVADAARAELDAEERRMRERGAELAEEKRKQLARMKQLNGSNSEPGPSATSGSASPARAKAAPPVPVARVPKAAPTPPPSRAVTGKAATLQSASPPLARSLPALQSSHPDSAGITTANATPVVPTLSASSPATAVLKTGGTSSTNPFHRLAGTPSQIGPSASPAQVSAKGSNNPFFRPSTGASVAPAPAVAQPIPRPPPPRTQPSDDWGDARESSDNDSDSDDDAKTPGQSVQQKRAGLAGLLFGGPGSAPTSRPGSAKPEESSQSAAPVPPRAPAAPLPKL